MKKWVVCIAAVLVFITLFGEHLLSYIPELPSRFAKYHHTGTVSLSVDGEKIDLKDVELYYVSAKSTKLVNGEFRFKKGAYGDNQFYFTVPHETLGDITVEFMHFNTNWWHVCEYKVDVSVDTNGDNIAANMQTVYMVEGGKENVVKEELFGVGEEIKLTTVTGDVSRATMYN